MSAIRSWLWPDRAIGKRESCILREEHNKTVNVAADLLAACERFDKAMERRNYPELQGITADMRAAIAKARGEVTP